MKAGWQTKPFEDCIEKVTYTTKIQRKDFLDAGAFPIVSQEDAFINGYWDGEDDVFRVGTPLVVFGDHTKVLKYVDFDFVLGADGVKLLPPKEFLVPKFFFYQLQTAQLDSLGYARHYKLLRELEITYPDKAEQQRIVALLDEAFAGIATAKANAEKSLQNARALFESRLQSVFTKRGEGWVEKSLEELGTITSSKRIFKSEYVKSGVPFYRTKEIKELANGRPITTELFISEGRYKEIKKSFGVPTAGDILLTAIGTIGEIWVVDGDSDFYFKDGNVLWLKEFNSINSHFLKYILLSFVESLNRMAHGAAYSALPIHRLNSHRVFLPTPAEQQAIVSTLDTLRDEIQRLESLYQQKLSALDELKKSFLHQAFSGQL